MEGTEGTEAPNVRTLLEASGVPVFSIWTNTTVELERLQRNVGSWRVPSLSRIRGTRLGKLDFKYFSGMETDPATRMEDQFDDRSNDNRQYLPYGQLGDADQPLDTSQVGGAAQYGNWA